MARGVLTVQNISRTGLTPTLGAADEVNGHVFDNTGENVLLYVNNGSGAPITVTIGDNLSTVDGMTVGAKTVAVAAGAIKLIGPFPKALYEKVSTGLTRAVEVDISEDTSVTLGALALPGPAY